jgi:hypothetical protein
MVRPADRSSDVLWIVLEDLILGSSRIRPTLLGQRERVPQMGIARWKLTCGIHELAQEAYTSCVCGFPCRVYINSNHQDS